MTRFKDFGSGPEQKAVEPISFKLHNEEFHCVPQVNGGFMLDLVSLSNDDDPAETSKMIKKFFAQVLEDESYTRFQELLNDKHRIVAVETLGEIVAWLLEEYSDRPEEQPEA